MTNIEIKNRWSREIIIRGKYENIKDCLEKNRTANLSEADLFGADLSEAYLSEANLFRAYLSEANLFRAYLSGAYLSGANLSGVKDYVNLYDFAQEIIHRQSIETFTTKEWAVLGQIFVHRLCWNILERKYKKEVLSICEKLAKAGFDEYLKEIKQKGD